MNSQALLWVSIGRTQYQHCVLLQDGAPMGVFKTNNFPTLDDVEDVIREILYNKQVNKCERTSPQQADCVVRFYEASQFKASDGENYYAYGAKVFVKNQASDKWLHYEGIFQEEELTYYDKYWTDVEIEKDVIQVGVECSYSDTYWRLIGV